MTDALGLRPATSSDRDFALAAHHAAYEGVVRRQFGEWDLPRQDEFFEAEWDPAATTVLLLGGEPCGYCVVEERDDDIHIRQLVIHPSAQGRGVGSEVIRRAQVRAGKRGVPVRLGTLHANRARDLYERMGFRVFDRSGSHVLMEWRPAGDHETAGAPVDHLLYGAPDLETGIDEIERVLGVRPVPGGRHPAYGTRNALLSLGPACYLEVIAPDRGLPRPDRGLGFGIEGIASPRLVTWAMPSREIETAAERAALGPVESGSRERDDGTVLHWRLTDPYAERMGGVIPFLIDWGETPHPAEAAPGGGRLVDLRLEHPAPEGIRRMLATLGCRGVSVRRGAAARLVAVIRPAGTGTAGVTVELT